MANDHRTPSEIEREIERDRSDLTRTINEIQSRFTPEAMVAEAMRTARSHGGDFGHAVSQSAKQNPVGLAITGIGLAWMIFGRSFSDRTEVLHRDRPAPAPRRRSVPGAGAPESYPDWYIEEEEEIAEYYGYPIGARPNVPGEDEGDGPSLSERARKGMGAAAESVSDGAASMRDSAASAAHSSAESARRMRERLARGTESMSEAARDRVVAARRRALMARDRMSDSARRNWRAGRDSAVGMFEENPLIAGALALAAGAAIAAALPSSRKEDEMFGRYSDDLMDEAERIYHEELDKAERVGRAALDETRKIVEEKGEQADAAAAGVAETVREEVSEAGERIKAAAKKEAKSPPSGGNA